MNDESSESEEESTPPKLMPALKLGSPKVTFEATPVFEKPRVGIRMPAARPRSPVMRNAHGNRPGQGGLARFARNDRKEVASPVKRHVTGVRRKIQAKQKAEEKEARMNALREQNRAAARANRENLIVLKRFYKALKQAEWDYETHRLDNVVDEKFGGMPENGLRLLQGLKKLKPAAKFLPPQDDLELPSQEKMYEYVMLTRKMFQRRQQEGDSGWTQPWWPSTFLRDTPPTNPKKVQAPAQRKPDVNPSNPPARKPRPVPAAVLPNFGSPITRRLSASPGDSSSPGMDTEEDEILQQAQYAQEQQEQERREEARDRELKKAKTEAASRATEKPSEQNNASSNIGGLSLSDLQEVSSKLEQATVDEVMLSPSPVKPKREVIN